MVGRATELLVTSLAHGQQLTSHAVVVATGSTYRRLDVPGEDELTCDGPFYRGADEVLVIGGGNSALEEGLHLTEFADRVRLLARSELSASAVLEERVRSDDQFIVHTGMDILELEAADSRFAGVVARHRDSGEVHRFPAAAVFVFIGLLPNTEFLGDSFERDDRGFLVTGVTMETTVPGVFVAGDVRSGSTKQLGSAVGEGIAALLMVRQHLEQRRVRAVEHSGV